jgi:hypothetical protein
MNRARREGDSFEEGLCLSLQAMLVSPHFLYRIEKDRTATAPAAEKATGQLNQYEIASRLSYFLWSSMPDDQLMSAASRGELRPGPVLNAQVTRMLKDAKANALVENFGGQWARAAKARIS